MLANNHDPLEEADVRPSLFVFSAFVAARLRVAPATVKRLLEDSVVFFATERGRERFFRLLQYGGRCFHGIFGFEPFLRLSQAMALTRKSMRLWGPLRLWVSLCAAVDAARRARASSSKSVDAVPGGATAINVQEGEKCGSHDNGNDASPSYWRHVLTAIAMSQDLVYHSLDHLALLERVQFLRLTPDRADLLDRFIEVFWLTEIIPTLWREIVEWRNMISCSSLTAAPVLSVDATSTNANLALVEPSTGTTAAGGVPSYFKSNLSLARSVLRSFLPTTSGASRRKIDTNAAKQQQVLSNLFKLALLDLPCVYFVLRGIGFRQSRKNQAWQGFLGMVASAISCFFQWRVATGRDLLLDYRQENAVPQKKQGHKADAHDEDAAGKHRRSPKSGKKVQNRSSTSKVDAQPLSAPARYADVCDEAGALTMETNTSPLLGAPPLESASVQSSSNRDEGGDWKPQSPSTGGKLEERPQQSSASHNQPLESSRKTSAEDINAAPVADHVEATQATRPSTQPRTQESTASTPSGSPSAKRQRGGRRRGGNKGKPADKNDEQQS